MSAEARSRATLSGVIVIALASAGCGEPPAYPPELAFALRDDRLVIRVPTAQPTSLGEPGKLDSELAALDALGGKTGDPTSLPLEARQNVEEFLIECFGSPAEPHLEGIAAERLAEGSRLYRRHCLQCHGLPGDGRGPTGQWIYPHPRDFRRGSFKFVSTGDGGKPRKSDLGRALRDGLKGTAMPAFGLLPEDQRDSLAEYVRYLSIRGQVEFQTLATLLTESEGTIVDGKPASLAGERLAVILRDWERAETAPPAPAPPPLLADRESPAHADAVRRGFELFIAKDRTDCLSCHEDFGRKATFRYDVWGTVVRPNDLTAGGFKGGDQPEAIYHRIRGGIQPSGMPAHPTLTDEQVWDLVALVRALPFPRDLPPDVRGKVHP
jgi:mono/diheme cytochrome c family protein